PRTKLHNEFSRSGGGGERRIYATAKDDALNTVGALQCDRQQNRVGLKCSRSSLDNSIEPAASRDLKGQTEGQLWELAARTG
ncbi:MAG TPA: hypothetical protein VGG60_16060, partial [Candidatus Binataceae bacterium]